MLTATESKITAVAIESFSESCAVASKVSDSIFLPIFRLKRNSQSLNTTETANIIIETNEYVEYVDLRKTVDSGLAVYDSEALSITSRIDDKQNNKVQMTIQSNISSQDEE